MEEESLLPSLVRGRETETVLLLRKGDGEGSLLRGKVGPASFEGLEGQGGEPLFISSVHCVGLDASLGGVAGCVDERDL